MTKLPVRTRLEQSPSIEAETGTRRKEIKRKTSWAEQSHTRDYFVFGGLHPVKVGFI